MTTWEVFHWDDTSEEDAWVPVGNYESEDSNYGYLGYTPDVAKEIGKTFGAGSYLFLNAETKRYETMTIAARQEFYEVPEEPDAEPDALARTETDLRAAIDPTAEAVMEREG